MTGLDRLRANGIALNWATVFVGWQHGFAETQEVQDYAASQFGEGTDDIDSLVLSLVDTDPTNTWKVRALLESLVAHEGPSSPAPETRWNLSSLKSWLASLPEHPTREKLAAVLDDVCDPHFHVLFPEACAFVFAPSLNEGQVSGDWYLSDLGYYQSLRRALQEWVEHEEA